MFWDVVIAVGIGLSQLFLCWYALHVSEKENRLRNGVVVGIAGLFGLALTVVVTVRATKSQNKLENEVHSISEKVEKPPKIVVNPPPITVTPVQPKQWAVMHFQNPTITAELGKPMSVLAICTTVSEYPARDVYCASKYFTVVLDAAHEVNKKIQQECVAEFNKTLSLGEAKPSAVKGEGIGGPSVGAIYTKEMDDALNVSKTQAVLVVGELRYRDELGKHRVEMCRWAEPPLTAQPLIWHTCEQHEGIAF